MTTNLMRDLATEPGNCFLVVPYGTKLVGDRPFDFGGFHHKVTEQTIVACGMTPHRADSIYGPAGVLDVVWRGIQKAEVVVVDFTGRSPNVAIEFGWALILGKRIIILTQDDDDIPTDVRGLYRYIRYSENFDDVDRMKQELSQQLAAIREEPADEKMLSPMIGGIDPAPAQIIALDPEFVTVKTDDGRRGILGNTDVDVTRVIRDMTRRFSLGERVNGAFVTDTKGSSRYSLVAGQSNPWRKIESDFPPGTRITGAVLRVVEGVGAFVPVGHGVDGRIHKSGLTANPHLARGSKVEATVIKVDVERRHVDLRLERAMTDSSAAVAASPDMPAVGMRVWGEVCAIKPGFLLIKLPGRDRPALLLSKSMSDELRREFDAGDLHTNEELYVEVTSVDPYQNRVLLTDALAPEEDNGEAIPIAA